MGGCTQGRRKKGKGTFPHPATAFLLVQPSCSDSASQPEQMRQERYKKVSATVSSAAGTSLQALRGQGHRNTSKTKKRKKKSSEKEEERGR